jgi:two-component system response regulator PhoP
MRVLIIEDELQLRTQISDAMRQQGYVVDTAADGDEGAWMACEFPIDVAIIDLGLPGKNGLEVIEELRKKGRDYPVLILTARDRWQDKVTGLEAGADDYLAKPFHMEELMARLRALIRRTGRWSQAELESGPMRLNTLDQIVELDGKVISLTAYEYRLLEYLVLHAGEVLSKTKLTEHIYAEDDERDSNVIEVFIRRLRKKLDPEGSLNPIETLRGRGYRWRLRRTHYE